MRSRNSKPISRAESAYLAAVKSAPCVLCGSLPTEAHHTKQGNHYTTVSLCKDCHTGKGGVHGDKTMQRIAKMDENDMINETIRQTIIRLQE